jgi:hypothetical protein
MAGLEIRPRVRESTISVGIGTEISGQCIYPIHHTARHATRIIETVPGINVRLENGIETPVWYSGIEYACSGMSVTVLKKNYI